LRAEDRCIALCSCPLLFVLLSKLRGNEVEPERRTVDDNEIGRIWAEYYPKSRENRDALQICGIICRLIRAETKLGFVISRSGKLQSVLDACGISKADFDEIEKGLFKEL